MKQILLTLILLTVMSCTTRDGVLKQAQPGSVSVSESNGKSGTLFLNGSQVDRLENGKLLLEDVQTGKQELTLFGEGHELATKNVMVKESSVSDVVFTLESAASGDLTIHSDEGAMVSFAGLSFGTLPSSGVLELTGFPAGEHVLSVMSGSKSMDSIIVLDEGDDIDVNAGLTLQQQVLVEHFSNVSCEYCPHHAEVMYHILDSLGWKNISKISYNANWPATDDPLYLFNPKPQLDRTMLYGAEVQYALPIFVVNGTVLQFNADKDKLAELLKTTIAQEQAKEPTFDIALTENSVTLTAVAEKGFNGTLRVNLVQDRVAYEEAPGSNGESVFLNAFRQLILEKSVSLAAGESVAESFTLDKSGLPATGLRITAFIQDNNGAIIQTADKKL